LDFELVTYEVLASYLLTITIFPFLAKSFDEEIMKKMLGRFLIISMDSVLQKKNILEKFS